MRKILMGLTAVAVAGGLVWAGEECDKSKCNVGEKVSKLLVSWQATAEAGKTECADLKAALNTEIETLGKQCPIGSRMGETLAFVRTALDIAVKADETCAKACAANAKPAAEGAKECEVAKLAEARTKLVKDLHQLVSYASAGGACEKACAKTGAVETAVKTGLCEKKVSEVVASVRADKCEVSAAKTILASVEGLQCEKKAGEIAASIRAESCEKKAGEILAKAASETCAKAGAVQTAVAAKTETCATSDACCKELMARSKALKASWEKAGPELISMCPTKRQELQTAFAGLQGRSKTLALMPDTMSALAMGIESVHAANTKMMEFAKANPDAMKDMPADVMASFKQQVAAIAEANEVLAKMGAAMKGSGACAEKKTETTTSVN